jgi:dephospho-CoA kinase
MLVLGLTGGVAMGKSTVAGMFREEGAAIFDADKAVHALYRGPAVALIEQAFPGTAANGTVDRAKLAAIVTKDKAALATLEGIVHPLVQAAEEEFVAEAARRGARVAVLDIPLLFETGGDKRVDAVVVVTTSPEIQRERLAERLGMTPTQLAALMARQMPDAERRRRAHFVIDTSGPLEATREQVRGVLRALAARAGAD